MTCITSETCVLAAFLCSLGLALRTQEKGFSCQTSLAQTSENIFVERGIINMLEPSFFSEVSLLREKKLKCGISFVVFAVDFSARSRIGLEEKKATVRILVTYLIEAGTPFFVDICRLFVV